MNLQKLIHYLSKGKFEKIWKGKDLEFFYEFVCSQGIPSKGFLLTLSLTGGGLVWFFYKIRDVQVDEQRARMAIESIEAVVPKDETSREIPERFKGYPVWRLP